MRSEPRGDSPQRMHHDVIFKLARTSEMLDEDTGGHVVRIRLLVEHIALELGFDPDDAEELGHDAMLHDVGKLKIPPDVLKKPGELTAHERKLMESHTTLGTRLLSMRPSMQQAALIAQSHHEAYDGSGYPQGLIGEQIPLAARITTAADMLDALISQRCYKEAWPFQKALAEIKSLAGIKLDPNIVAALERAVDHSQLHRALGIPYSERADPEADSAA